MTAAKIMLKNNADEPVWKLKDGSLKPISEMTDAEIIKFRKICLRKNRMYHFLQEKFSDFVDCFDDALKQRIELKQQSLNKLIEAEKA
jgi:hypothetical protein